jgi:hypothetical protein
MVLATAEGVAAITAGATLLAAAGLAYVTIHTTKLRLGEERERQKRALAAETDRQQASLLHDRELVDIADLRQLLDAGATALDQATRAQDSASHVVVLAAGEFSGEGFDKLLAIAKEEMEAAVPPVVALGARLRVRLGPSDSITQAFTEATTALNDLQSMVMFLVLGLTKRGDDVAKAQAATVAYQTAVRAFVAASVKRAGTAVSRAEA